MKAPSAMATTMAATRARELAEIKRLASNLRARLVSPAEFERRNPSPAAIEMQRRVRAELEAVIQDPTRGLTVYFSSQRRARR